MNATAEEVRAILDESRNGINHPIRHPLARKFYYSDGVKELADAAGCHWLLDLVGTEVVPAYNRAMERAGTSYVEMSVKDGKALVKFTIADDAPPEWSRSIGYTDFPDGEWVLFEIGRFDAVGGVIAILPSEH